MVLRSLSIDRFRNLAPVALQCSPQLNLFIGENAAGKTSILEALYVLGRARSFRTRHLEKAIQHGTEAFNIVGRVLTAEGREIPVGVGRQQNQLVARIDGKPVQRLSDLAALFPLQWVGGNLHRLIEEGPAYRRQYLDWGLFHVKHSYIPTWKRYQKLLKQRNAALRVARSSQEILAWDGEFVAAAEELHAFRLDYVKRLNEVVDQVLVDLLALPGAFHIGYRRGWPADQNLKELMHAGLPRDRDHGFTRSGPHRADLTLLYDEAQVAEQLSRGQQKLLVIGLQVAQAHLLRQLTGCSSVFLLDDLGAELDSDNQAKVMNLLGAIDAQVFATAIELPDRTSWNIENYKGFHVKHGSVSEMV